MVLFAIPEKSHNKLRDVYDSVDPDSQFLSCQPSGENRIGLKNSGNTFFVSCKSHRAAVTIERRMKIELPEFSRNIRLDRNIQIPVNDVNMYAKSSHLLDLAKSLRMTVKTKKNHIMLETNVKGAKSNVSDIHMSSYEQQSLQSIFDVVQKTLPPTMFPPAITTSHLGDELIFGWASGIVEEFQALLETDQCNIHFDRDKLLFRVSGMAGSRSDAIKFIDERIKEVEKSRFKRKISFQSYNLLQNVMTQLDELRETHNASAAISLDMHCKKTGSEIISTISIFSFDQESGMAAFKEIKAIAQHYQNNGMEDIHNDECKSSGDDMIHCCNCWRELNSVNTTKDHPNLIRPDLCGCNFCVPCFTEMISLQLRRRNVKYEDAMPIMCLGCIDENENIILISDCKKVSKDLGRKFSEATNRIYANKSANAADSWINTCERTRCNTQVRVPRPPGDVNKSNKLLSSPLKTSSGIYKCPKSWCYSIYCASCGQIIYNKWQLGRHKCSYT